MTGDKRWLWVAVIGMTLIGLCLRVLMFREAAFGDELSTLWIIRGNDPFGVISTVYSDAEITPPLFFVLAKVGAWIFGATISGVRSPSLAAGVLIIPAAYLVGVRMLGRRGALYATAIATVSPLLVYFSGIARAYAVMLLLLFVATWFLLEATTGKGRNWAWFGWAIAGCLAVYSHYTAALAIGGQLIWVLWFFPALRWRAIAFGGLMVLLYLPWVSGFRADLDSPTSHILREIQGSGFTAKWDATKLLLFLRVDQNSPGFFGRPDLIIGSIGFLVGAGAILASLVRGRFEPPAPELRRGMWLALLMPATVLLGELLLLAAGNDIYGERNLTAAWVGIPFAIAALGLLAGPRWGIAAVALVVVAYSYSTAHLLNPANSTLAFDKVAAEIRATEDEGGTILDQAFLSPAPLSALDGYLETDLPEFQITNLEDRPDFIDGLFSEVDAPAIAARAFDTDGPVRLLTAGELTRPVEHADGSITFHTGVLAGSQTVTIPAGWRIEKQTEHPGLEPLVLTTFVRDEKGRETTGE